MYVHCRLTTVTALVHCRTDFVTVTAVRRLGVKGPAHANIATRNGTALPGRQYAHTTATLVWADGEGGGKSVQIPLRPSEHSGQFFYVELVSGNITLSEPSAARVTLGTYVDTTIETNGAARRTVSALLLCWVAAAMVAARRYES